MMEGKAGARHCVTRGEGWSHKEGEENRAEEQSGGNSGRMQRLARRRKEEEGMTGRKDDEMKEETWVCVIRCE